VLLLAPAAVVSCDSEVVVAIVPFTDLVNAVNVIVLTLKRTCNISGRHYSNCNIGATTKKNVYLFSNVHYKVCIMVLPILPRP
jgi:hypothetical protein